MGHTSSSAMFRDIVLKDLRTERVGVLGGKEYVVRTTSRENVPTRDSDSNDRLS